MANKNVRFFSVDLRSKYDALVIKDPLALYWIEETKELYKGDILFGTGVNASEKAAGLLSAADYVELQKLIAAGGTVNLEPVDASIIMADGKIGVGVSAVEGNFIKVVDDGIFAEVDKVAISQVEGLEARLANIEEAVKGGIHYRGTVATKDELPTDAEQGDLYECIDTGIEYCWNGNEWFEYGSAHFVPVEGTAIQIDGSTINVKLSAVEGNALSVAEDGGLFAPKCDFTDKDRVVIDTLPMLYVTKTEMDNVIARAIADNQMVWEHMDSVVGVAQIGDTYYATVNAALAAAQDGDTVKISAGTYDMIEFTKATAPNITLVGDEGVYVGKVRLMETTNYSAPDGLKLKNITFNGEGITASDDTINNMSIVGCNFVDGAVIHVGSCITDGLIIENCEFEATNSTVNTNEKTAILIQGTSKNVIIRGNNIKDAEHNAIQVVGASGSMLIDSNIVNNTGSRAMRITTKDGAVLAIMNNTMANANTNPAEAEENAGQIIKITGVVVNGAMANNTYNGNELVFNDGIGQVI